MFSELIKLREIKRLLKKGEFEEVLVRAADPSIRDHRQVVLAAEKARRALLDAAARRRNDGDLTRAFHDVRAVLRDGENREARTLERDVRDAIADRSETRRGESELLLAARQRAADGELSEALTLLSAAGPGDGKRVELLKDLVARDEATRRAEDVLRLSVRKGDVKSAFGALNDILRVRVDLPALPELLAALLELRDAEADIEVSADVFRCTAKIVRRNAEVARTIDAFGQRWVAAVEHELVLGGIERAGAALAKGPFPREIGDRAAQLRRLVEDLNRALAVLAAGDAHRALSLYDEVLVALPPSKALKARRDEIAARAALVSEPLASARSALSSGQLIRARSDLLDILEREPGHREAKDLLLAVEKQEQDDLESLRKARDLLSLGVEGSLEDCRRILVGLEARRPDLSEIPGLLRDVERRLREAERASPSRTPEELAGGAADFQNGSTGPLSKGAPFILRVEEHGDHYVEPRERVLIGNALAKAADLPVLAAIGARHAFIERRRSGADAVAYALVPVPGKSCLRNRKPVTGEAILHHGDVLSLGGVLGLTFLRPIAGNATAILRVEGDFDVHGCRHVILFSESGRSGSLVLGPGPEAHVPLPMGSDKVEILRVPGEGQGDLYARSAHGVALGDGSERPKVRLLPGQSARAGEIRFFLERHAP